MNRLAKRSVLIAGSRTGVRLGSAMWEALEDIAHQTGSPVSVLMTEIDRERKRPTLNAAIRNYVVAYYRAIMQAARYGDAGQRCPIIPVDDLERNVTEPLSGTPKVIPTRWRAQPLHGVYSLARQVALLFIAVLPVTLLGGATVSTDR